jgi:phosphoribosylanthranilate isomerase
VTRVKLCGIMEASHALVAVEAGADFVGMVFAPSRRRITSDKGREISQALKALPARPLIVGVFVNAPPSEVNQLTRLCGLDYVQLSGDEPVEYMKGIEKPIIKAIHIKGEPALELLSGMEEGYKALGSDRLIYLLDSRVGEMYGGTGRVADWDIAAEIASRFPIILAGGLSPQNVSQAIRKVKPWGVDVSSGVETDGVKDMAKMKAFVQIVRDASESVA